MTILAGAEQIGNFTMSFGGVEVEWCEVTEIGGAIYKVPTRYGHGDNRLELSVDFF